MSSYKYVDRVAWLKAFLLLGVLWDDFKFGWEESAYKGIRERCAKEHIDGTTMDNAKPYSSAYVIKADV